MKQALLAIILSCAALAQTKTGTKSAKKGTAARPSLLNPASLKARAPETFRVRFATTKGDIVIDVTRSWAPRGADRFYNLVRAGFFTDCAFFRIVPRFVAQFGISPQPAVAKVWENARIFDDPVKVSNKRGTIVFATSGPNTRTTQLFINFSDNAALDSQGFAPFGEVSEGMQVVDSLNAEYGERPDQGHIQSQGKAYLDRYFPHLDRILKATIERMPAAAPAAATKK
jgi:peptidyl-prolyl cis-trans isomerase A (cyclophilin A)